MGESELEVTIAWPKNFGASRDFFVNALGCQIGIDTILESASALPFRRVRVRLDDRAIAFELTHGEMKLETPLITIDVPSLDAALANISPDAVVERGSTPFGDYANVRDSGAGLLVQLFENAAN